MISKFDSIHSITYSLRLTFVFNKKKPTKPNQTNYLRIFFIVFEFISSVRVWKIALYNIRSYII